MNPGRTIRSWTDRRRSGRAVIGVAALAAATLALSGCSGAGSSNGHVTLTYGIYDEPQLGAMRTIVKDFEAKHPNITVDIQLTPWDTYWTKLQTAATSGAAPDVFWMTNAYFPAYAKGGVLMPLNDVVKKEKLNTSDYLQAQVEAYTSGGQLYGIPKDVDAIGLWYNKQLFKEADVAPPTASWTADDLIKAAQKLTNRSKGVYGIAAQNSDQQSYYTTIPQNGGYVISPDGKKSGFDSPQAIKGIQFWVDLINRYHVSPTLQQMTDTDPDTMFQAGKVAMIYEGSWAVAQWNQVPYAKANVNVAPLPRFNQPGGVTNGLANVISAKTAHPAEAEQFLAFLGSKQAADIQARTGTVIPAYKGTAQEWVKSSPNYDLSVFADELKVATPMPASLNTKVWRTYATNEFTKAWTGAVSVPAAAHAAATEMNQELATEQSGK